MKGVVFDEDDCVWRWGSQCRIWGVGFKGGGGLGEQKRNKRADPWPTWHAVAVRTRRVYKNKCDLTDPSAGLSLLSQSAAWRGWSYGGDTDGQDAAFRPLDSERGTCVSCLHNPSGSLRPGAEGNMNMSQKKPGLTQQRTKRTLVCVSFSLCYDDCV